MPEISVVIPVHNGESTIFKTAKSVLNQSFCDFEIIIINSGSTDNTESELLKINDSRVSIFKYPKALVSVNRNLGIKHSKGKFIAFLDADDLWSPDKLELQLKELQRNPKAGLVYSLTRCIDQDDKVIRNCSLETRSGNVLDRLLIDDFIGSGSNVMIRREVLEVVGGFDESLTNAEDTDLWLRVAAKYEFAVVPKAQIFYRISHNSKSSNVGLAEKSNLKVIQKSFAAAPKSLQYLKQYRVANLYKYLTYRALEVDPGCQKTLLVLKFIILSIKTDPKLIFEKAIHKSWIKLIVMVIMPRKMAIQAFRIFPKLSNTSTLLGYGKLDFKN